MYINPDFRLLSGKWTARQWCCRSPSSCAYWSGKSRLSTKYVARSARSADATFALGTSHSWMDTISNNENTDWLFCPSFCLQFLLQLLAFSLDKPTYRKITIRINRIIYKTVPSIFSHRWFRHRVRNTTLCGSVAGRSSSCKNPVAVQVNLDIHIINANVDLGQRNSKSHI